MLVNKNNNFYYIWIISGNYKFHNPERIYFVSFAVVEWLGAFTKNEYKNIIIDSLHYCQKEKGILDNVIVIK